MKPERKRRREKNVTVASLTNRGALMILGEGGRTNGGLAAVRGVASETPGAELVHIWAFELFDINSAALEFWCSGVLGL